jgi:hypothetical protein
MGNPDGHTEILIAADDWMEIPFILSALRPLPTFACSFSVFPVHKSPSGSHVAGYNKCVELSRSDVSIFTHPEIMFDSSTVKSAVLHAQSERFVTYKPFWIPQSMQEKMDTFPWQKPELLELEPALYERATFEPFGEDGSIENWGKGWNEDMRARTDWESTTTFAMDRHTLSRMGPWPQFEFWGPDDPWHQGRRNRLAVRTHVSRESMVYHQWHSRPSDGSVSRELIDTVALRAL